MSNGVDRCWSWPYAWATGIAALGDARPTGDAVAPIASEPRLVGGRIGSGSGSCYTMELIMYLCLCLGFVLGKERPTRRVIVMGEEEMAAPVLLPPLATLGEAFSDTLVVRLELESSLTTAAGGTSNIPKHGDDYAGYEREYEERSPPDCLALERLVSNFFYTGYFCNLLKAICRGTDIFKAIALGADFCLSGRVPIWGLAWNGAAGVELALKTLKAEFETAMSLAGCKMVADISTHHLSVLNSKNLVCRLEMLVGLRH